jgi:hypothetical protein
MGRARNGVKAMATRYGCKFGGKTFHVCETCRKGLPIYTFFVNGVRVSAAFYKTELATALAADKNQTGKGG